MKNQHVFPLGLYLHVAAGTELRWMFANGVARALLSQGSYAESTRRLDLQGCCVKFQECLSFETWWQRWYTVKPHAWNRCANVMAAGAACAVETVDGGDVTGLGE